MPRPRKWRRVCCLPESNLYGPLNRTKAEDEILLMTVDQYETIRLIDLEGLTQEEAAEKMHVARSSVQLMYKDARTIVAESLVNGNILRIEGGDIQLYSDKERKHGCGRCRRKHCGNKDSQPPEEDDET